jgi:nucleoside-diphosphate-sugar epimerase
MQSLQRPRTGGPPASSYYAAASTRSKAARPALDLVVRLGPIPGRDGQGLFHQLLDNIGRLRVVPVFGGGRQPLETVHVDDACARSAAGSSDGSRARSTWRRPNPVPMATFLRMMAQRLGIRCVFVPVPFAPVLAGLCTLETLRVPLRVARRACYGRGDAQGSRCATISDASG